METDTDAAKVARWRAYAAGLRTAAAAYAQASNATGMDRTVGRREAATYLQSEADRLIREAATVMQHADDTEYRMRTD